MCVCVCYLPQAEVQCVSWRSDSYFGGFEVTQGQSLTGKDVVTNQFRETTGLVPFLKLKNTHTRQEARHPDSQTKMYVTIQVLNQPVNNSFSKEDHYKIN